MKKYVLLLIFLIIGIRNNAQTGWFEITPTNYNNVDGGAIYAWNADNVSFVASHGIFYKSTDGGASWTQNSLNMSTNVTVTDMNFHNNVGIIIGQLGLAFTTTDGGNTWTQANVGTTEMLNKCIVTQDDHIWIVGENGTLLSSFDNGTTWQNNNLTTENLNSIIFLDNQTGYLAGNNSTLYKTMDGGLNWIQENITISGYDDDIFSLSGTNTKTYALIGQAPPFAHSQQIYNNSSNWAVMNINLPNELSDIYAVNDNIKLAVSVMCTTGGYCQLKVYKTNDDFQNLNISFDGNSYAEDISIANENTYYLLTSDKIYKTIDGGTYTSNIPIDNSISNSFKIYPNPINSNFQIKFDNSFDINNCKLIIYDLQGRKVMDKKLMVNTNINIDNLQSGNYILEIIKNNKTLYVNKILKL